MKKTFISMLLTLSIIISIMPNVAFSANTEAGNVIWATKVEDFYAGTPHTPLPEQTTESTLGKPDTNKVADTTKYYPLGKKGALFLSFGTEFDTNYDIHIYEVGSSDGGVVESVDVAVSYDFAYWYPVGTTSQETSVIDLNKYIDEDLKFKYVRLTDTGKNGYGKTWAGADIDAVSIVKSKAQKLTPATSQNWNGHTYQLFDESMTWEESKAYCESIGGHLATVTSEEEQKIVESLIPFSKKNTFWLGGTDEDSEGEWKWVTGEKWEYTNWRATQPDNYRNVEHYLQIYGDFNAPSSELNKWNDMTATNYYGNETSDFNNNTCGFICEFESAKVSLKGHSYQLFDKSMTWEEAKAYCEGLGGYLATITSEEEQKTVHQLVKNGSKNTYWIGATEKAGKMTWVTGEDVIYEKWGENEPTSNNEIYLEIVNNEWGWLKSGDWNDTLNTTTGDYSIYHKGFVCEFPNKGYNPDGINVLVNGIYVEFDYAPFIQNGRTLVPIRAIAEALGSNVEWNEATQTAVIQRGLDTAVFQINKNKVFAKETITLDVAAQVINNRTYIPVRALSEVFGASVKWDEDTNTVIINTEELSDEAIFRDFCDNGFYDFDYFSKCFMNEHMSGGIFNSYMWQSAASHLSDWAKKVVTFKVDNYEEDAYKENLKLLLSNVTATPDVNVMKAASDSLAAKIAEGLEKTKGFEVDELCDFINKNIDTLSDNELFTYIAIGEDAKILGDAMKKAGLAINIAALTAEDIAFLLTDFSQNAYYLHKIKDAAGEDCDKALKDAIDSLMIEYTDKYVKVINDVGTFAYTTALDIGTSAILQFAGSSVGSLYAISAFVIEQGATALGAKKYSESVESAIFLMGIHNNIVHDNYNKTKSNIVNYKVSEKATKDSWQELVHSFELTKACTIEAYKCMKEVTEDVAEKLYLEKQIEVAKSLNIASELPENGSKIFTIK